MAGKNPIDLSRIPAPDIVESLDYETLLQSNKTQLLELAPELADTLELESEPAVKILQLCAYRELLLRQRVNEAARAVMLAFASGTTLEHLGALMGVTRLTITPADPNANPPTAAVMEKDDDYRARIQLALDGLSTAGPELAYIYHALSASGLVLDASVITPVFSMASIDAGVMAQLPPGSIVLQVDDDAGLLEPMPGDVVITVLSRENNGVPDVATLQAVYDALNAESVRPLTDNVHTQAAQLIDFTIIANLYTFPGPDTNVVLQEANDKLSTYLEENQRLGRSITLSGIYAALHVAGVQRVEIIAPVADIICTSAQAARCTTKTINHGGIAE
ncbi:phage-related baseplate assembly protein [Alteromonadaceae bacterium 2753L.S.0a.02]|nr:phage-related baseplate assembly protein [Alteromonadaceae bacterium 2753L.S.0a.02]